MSAFTDKTNWHEKQGAGYITTAPLSWEIGQLGSGLWLHVPPGFVFDVSVPRWLHWAFDPHDPRYHNAAALHDYALWLGWDRVASAAAFSAALKACGVNRLERLAMVICVIIWRFS